MDHFMFIFILKILNLLTSLYIIDSLLHNIKCMNIKLVMPFNKIKPNTLLSLKTIIRSQLIVITINQHDI